MRRRISSFMAALLLCACVLSQEAMAVELPDLGELVAEAASGIADAAGNAGDTLSGVAGKAGR